MVLEPARDTELHAPVGQKTTITAAMAVRRACTQAESLTLVVSPSARRGVLEVRTAAKTSAPPNRALQVIHVDSRPEPAAVKIRR